MRRSGGRMVGEWNDTGVVVAAVAVPGVFAAVAVRSRDAVAVVCGDAVVSYGELDAAAGRLAGVLAGVGAGPGRVVAVARVRSAQLVTALLEVWRAGARRMCRWILGWPVARVAQVLADSGRGAGAAAGGCGRGRGVRWRGWGRGRVSRW